MSNFMTAALAAFAAGIAFHAQEIVEVPASKAGVVLPDDIFGLPPGQWFMAMQVSQGSVPCTPEACEAGFHSGDLVISVEQAKEFVRIIAGFRGCPSVAFQEIEIGAHPTSYKRNQVSGLIKDVVKGAEKSCKLEAPPVPKLNVKSMFERPSN